MTSYRGEDDAGQNDWDEEVWGDEDWSDEASEEDPVDQTVACPHCGEQVYDDSPRCPSCGQYLLESDLASSTRPWWIVVGAAACLYAVFRWIFG
ncbi:MAG: zinc-ribbon domain-containing protein [Planctomycetota bacterium]